MRPVADESALREQAALLDARSSGTYRSKTIERAQHFLDLQAARIDVS